MAVKKRKRPQPQYDLFYNDKLYSWQATSTAVGNFFEHLTAQLFEGYRVSVEDEFGNNPDVETVEGRSLESKGSRRSYWKITLEQLGRMVGREGAYYVLWRYERGGEKALHKQFEDTKELNDFLAANIRSCYVISPKYVRRLLSGKTYAWGPDGYHCRYLREADIFKAIEGELKLKGANFRSENHGPLRYLDWTTVPLLVHYIDDGSAPPVVPF